MDVYAEVWTQAARHAMRNTEYAEATPLPRQYVADTTLPLPLRRRQFSASHTLRHYYRC